LVDQAAPRAINNPDAGSGFRETFRVQNMTGLGRKRGMQRDKIGKREEIIEVFHQLNLQAARARRGKIRVECDHAHAKGNSAPAQLTPYSAHANDAKRLVV